MTRRTEATLCYAVAAAIVILQSILPMAFEQYFDSDQAVYGLMAKHLSEGRAFPLYFYGQNYLLGVQSWLAVPWFWIGGPTVPMLRLSVMGMNMAVALGFVWWLGKFGLRPIYALAAALPVIAFTPVKAMEFGAVYGAGIEPFGYALLLWLLRHRPLAFGALLGFGTLHREFTFLALPALFLVTWRDPVLGGWRPMARRLAGFAIVWLVVDQLKRHVNMLGPAGGTFEAGAVTLGAQTFVQWLSPNWGEDLARVWAMVTDGLPILFGARRYTLSTFSFPSELQAGSLIAGVPLILAAGVIIGRLPWLARRRAAAPGEYDLRVYGYLAALGVMNVLIYGLNGGIAPTDTPVLRYALYAPLVIVALAGVYFSMERTPRVAAIVAVLLGLWASGAVVDNARLLADFSKNPPAPEHRQLTDYLIAHNIKYARAIYWDAYVITFLSKERVIVKSTSNSRISSYDVLVDQHADEAVTLQRLPCDTGTKVAGWCVIGPGGS